VKLFLFLIKFALLFFVAAPAWASSVEFRNIVTRDGTTMQVCYRYPDSVKFPGKRPAVMTIPGSGRYDTCRALEKAYADSMSEKGIIVFARQKRGLTRNLTTGGLEINNRLYKTADIPHLQQDTLFAFESLQQDPRVDAKNCGLFGGSEGTILSTFIATHHPEIRDVSLVSSMIEPFVSLFQRQFYELLPRELILAYDKNTDGLLSEKELPNVELAKYKLLPFDKIDQNHDGFLDYGELVAEIKRIVAYSVNAGDDTFFLSDIGGQTPLGWYLSALKLGDLASQILKLKMAVHIYHGTLDTNTDVKPVRVFQAETERLQMNNISFNYYDGLTHQLSSEVINEIYSEIALRLTKDNVFRN
jgi:hypothetical protein